MSPIISLKAKDKLELIGWKVKNIRKKMWYWDDVMCKWKNFSFKCFLSNVEEINLLLSLFKKLDFCYLMANNQLKCSIIYEKIAMRAGEDEWIIYYEWSKKYQVTQNKNKFKLSEHNECKQKCE